MQKHSNKFIVGAIVGTTIGAITTLLFSTSEGRKIQKKLMKKFHDMNHKNSEMLHHGFAKVKHTLMHKKAKRKARRKSK